MLTRVDLRRSAPICAFGALHLCGAFGALQRDDECPHAEKVCNGQTVSTDCMGVSYSTRVSTPPVIILSTACTASTSRHAKSTSAAQRRNLSDQTPKLRSQMRPDYCTGGAAAAVGPGVALTAQKSGGPVVPELFWHTPLPPVPVLCPVPARVYLVEGTFGSLLLVAGCTGVHPFGAWEAPAEDEGNGSGPMPPPGNAWAWGPKPSGRGGLPHSAMRATLTNPHKSGGKQTHCFRQTFVVYTFIATFIRGTASHLTCDVQCLIPRTVA